MTTESLRDCALSPIGVKQCEFAAHFAHQIRVGLILVSPLVRALETAYYLFKDHPDKPVIKVVPIMREHLHSVCDIPANILEIKEKFTSLYSNFDFSLFE